MSASVCVCLCVCVCIYCVCVRAYAFSSVRRSHPCMCLSGGSRNYMSLAQRSKAWTRSQLYYVLGTEQSFSLPLLADADFFCRAPRMGSRIVCGVYGASKYWYGLPSSLFVLQVSAHAKSKKNCKSTVLTFAFIFQRTDLFRNDEAIKSFVKFYSTFDFLEPPEIGKYGKAVDDSNYYNPQGP